MTPRAIELSAREMVQRLHLCEKAVTDCQREADLDAITIEQQLTFARMQFDHLSLTGPAHKMRDLAQRLARLQQRILALEAAS
jgi:hypothetical protein